MEPTTFRFIISQNRANTIGVISFMMIFTLITLIMVELLVGMGLGENAELAIISIVVFGQFLLFIPVLFRMCRGIATVTLTKNRITVQLKEAKVLLTFNEIEIPFSDITSYKLTKEGKSRFYLRLKKRKESFNLHPMDNDLDKFSEEAKSIIHVIEAHRG